MNSNCYIKHVSLIFFMSYTKIIPYPSLLSLGTFLHDAFNKIVLCRKVPSAKNSTSKNNNNKTDIIKILNSKCYIIHVSFML